MRLVRARIKNFRAISDLEVDLGQHAVFLGSNGVGKSCILKAVDRFFGNYILEKATWIRYNPQGVTGRFIN